MEIITIIVNKNMLTDAERITNNRINDDEIIQNILIEKNRFFASKQFLLENGGRVDYFAFQESEFDIIGKCVCGFEHEGDEIFQWTDYVSQPMVWCNSCGRRSFICINCQPRIIETPDTISYFYSLMTIESVRNCQLYNYGWTPELFKEHFVDFLSTRDREDFCKKIGLEYFDDGDDRPADWTFSVPCGTTDSKDVKMPLDMRHDGINIFCRCHCDKCNTKIDTNYWGD